MVLAQLPAHIPAMNSLLHHLHPTFQDSENSPRQQVVSQSKVDKGDAWFSTHKRILGWKVDSQTMTLHLPQHWLERLHSLLHTTLAKNFTTCKQWQQLLEELHSMTLALQSSTLLFSVLQNLLKGNQCCMHITTLAKCTLQDWVAMLQDIAAHPIAIMSLIPHAPHFIGATDASKDGMGG